MEEIRRVIRYRVSILGQSEGGKVLALCLSSRRNMCIHPRVQEEGDRDTVDGICRKMTASWVRANDTDGLGLCNFYESYSRDGSNAGNSKNDAEDLYSLLIAHHPPTFPSTHCDDDRPLRYQRSLRVCTRWTT